MESPRLTFARTLDAVDTPSVNIRADSSFHKFSRLPSEIRLAVWQHALPDPEAERPALFSQRHNWSNSDGVLLQPEGFVPICMTTTCAALLHVNQESRRTVLLWAERQEYQLCYRRFCRDEDNLYDDEELLPVQGPIFVRAWNPSKDVLNVHAISDHDGIPTEEWDEHYVGDEQLINVQHLALSLSDINDLLRSRWFLQLLAATPDLKTLSFDDGCYKDNGETFHDRFVDTRDIGDPWMTIGGGSGKKRNKPQSWEESTYVRWEMAPKDPESPDRFEAKDFEKRLKEAYVEGEYWPPTEDDIDTSDDYSTSKETEMEVLAKLPPWVWDPDKDGFAFEVRAFEMAERRGYDDVRDGLMARCPELYEDC